MLSQRLLPSVATIFALLACLSALVGANQVEPRAGQSAITTFCKSFVTQCYKTALEGQVGDVSVIQSCERTGGKDSTSYTYSCRRGKTNITERVLNALGNDFVVYTTQQSTRVRTATRTVRRTEVATTTRRPKTTTTATETFTTVRTLMKLTTVPEALVMLTETIPTTISDVTTTELATTTNTLTTTTRVSTTLTQFEMDGEVIPVEEVEVGEEEGSGQSGRRKRSVNAFCASYSLSCSKECVDDGSTVKVVVCQSSQAPKYTLGCVCKNNDRFTQHALVRILEDEHISTIKKVRTTTTYVTRTRMTTVPTTVVNPRVLTLTTEIPVSSTETVETTRTAGTVTQTTSETTSTTQTQTASSTITEDAFATETLSVTSTTKIVHAATGYARAFALEDGYDMGFLSLETGESALQLNSLNEFSSPVELMAVKDEASGLYQLAQMSDITKVLQVTTMDTTWGPGLESYGGVSMSAAANCFEAGEKAGPTEGGRYGPCETFIFKPQAFDNTPGATRDTVKMRGSWYNPDNTIFSDAVWTWQARDSVMYMIADIDAWNAEFGELNTPFSIRFPAELPPPP